MQIAECVAPLRKKLLLCWKTCWPLFGPRRIITGLAGACWRVFLPSVHMSTNAASQARRDSWTTSALGLLQLIRCVRAPLQRTLLFAEYSPSRSSLCPAMPRRMRLLFSRREASLVLVPGCSAVPSRDPPDGDRWRAASCGKRGKGSCSSATS